MTKYDNKIFFFINTATVQHHFRDESLLFRLLTVTSAQISLCQSFITYQFLCKDFGLTLVLICDIVRYPTEKPRPLPESPSSVNYKTPQFFENRTIFSVRDALNIKMQFHRIFDTKSYFFWHDFLNILPICVASRHRRKTCHTKKKTAKCCLSNEPMYNDVRRKT